MNYIISLGSNMGESKKILEQAVETLRRQEGLQVEKVSSLYRTKPWGKIDQPLFLNAAAEVGWEKSPEQLMLLLLDIEQRFGRKRLVHWGPRSLDLDLIYAKGMERNSSLLKLPHPYFWERPFVLVPLEEMEPDFEFKGEKIHNRILALHGYEDVEKLCGF